MGLGVWMKSAMSWEMQAEHQLLMPMEQPLASLLLLPVPVNMEEMQGTMMGRCTTNGVDGYHLNA